MLVYELLNVVSHREEPEPLFLIERHWIAPESLDRNSTTLSNLQENASPSSRAQLFVLFPEPLKLLAIIVLHGPVLRVLV
jgi:hypothetical protein